SRRQLYAGRRAPPDGALAVVPGDPGNAAHLDSLLVERLRFLVGGLAVDVALLDLAVVDTPRLLREASAHVVAVLLDLLAQLAQNLAHRSHLRWRGRRRGRLALADTRRHRRLLDPPAAADRAGNPSAGHLGIESVTVGKPCLEDVVLRALQIEQNHRMP